MAKRLVSLTLAGVLASTAAYAQQPVAVQPSRSVTIRPQLDVPMRPVQPETLHFELVPIGLDIPKVEVAIEPAEGDALVYQPVAGWTANDAKTGQLSVLLYIRNQEGQAITLDKVAFAYGNQTKEIAGGGLTINPSAQKAWQNNREYHQVGDVLYFESATPSSVTIRLHFKGFALPVTITKPLKRYGRAFAPPFHAADLRADEFWESASTHGGGSQVFAYDMGVEIPGQGALLPQKDGSANSHFRVWGKPIYAMADGVVKGFHNGVPNNPKPGEQADWDDFTNGGAGNHFYIRHGDVIALYAHLQKGTLNGKLTANGAAVKRGDLLGLAGNSGSSSAPHLHVHVRKETTIETGPFRPLVFDRGFVIAKDSYAAPKSNVAWSELTKLAVPGKAAKRSYIWPAAEHPYCGYPTNWGEVARHGVADAKYQDEFDKAWTCGYAPVWVDGYAVGGQTFFNVVFRPEKAPWVARHNLDGAKYQSEFEKWTRAGYRLINVDSYLRGGSVRYAAVWEKSPGPPAVAYHGKPAAAHQTTFESLAEQGYTPVNVSPVVVGGQRFVTALYEKKNTGGFYLKSAMTLAQYRQLFDQYGREGFKLVYLNGYLDGGQPRLSGIWYRNVPYSSYWAKHHLSAAAYQAEYTNYLGTGYITRAVTGYQDGGHRYEGIWTK